MQYTIVMPKLSPTMESGQIVKWHKKIGEFVKEGDLLFDVNTDKATIEYRSPEEGFLRKIYTQENQAAARGASVAILTSTLDEKIDDAVSSPPAFSVEKKETMQKVEETAEIPSPSQPSFVPEPPLETVSFQESSWEFHKRALASPLARRLAQQEGLDLESTTGSGPDGMVVSRDLLGARKKTPFAFCEKTRPEIPAGSYVEEKPSLMRQVIGKRLQEAKSFIPHFYVTQEIQMSLLVEIRKELKSAEIDVTVNDCIVKAAALALRENPHVNSGFHSVNQTIIRFQTIDIAVAVSLPEGLITPIIRYADYKNLSQISQEIKALSLRAKEGKLRPEEYKGGSFTISNLGMYGIHDFQAVLNPPQAAILAVGAIEDKPLVSEGALVAGKVLTVALSADHRVVDGRDAALFLGSLKKFLENPSFLLLG